MKYALLAIFFALLIAGCETTPSPLAPSTSSRSAFAEPPRDRPSLGTKWGETRRSAFRFGPVRESYANEKYHNTRNVGVIGIALFNERGTNPWT